MHTSTRIGFSVFAGIVLGAVLGRILFEAGSFGALAGGAVGLALAWVYDRGEE